MAVMVAILVSPGPKVRSVEDTLYKQKLTLICIGSLSRRGASEVRVNKRFHIKICIELKPRNF